jgi:hypothetical protein
VIRIFPLLDGDGRYKTFLRMHHTLSRQPDGRNTTESLEWRFWFWKYCHNFMEWL